MDATTLNQVYLFGIYSVCGIIIGIFFDLFRILRRSFKTPDIVTYIEDILFGIFTGIFLIFILFVFNNGEMRFFMFFAIMLGLLLYLLTISKYFIKINVTVLVTIKKIIKRILLILVYPITLLKKILSRLILKPFRILTIDINNLLKTNKMKKTKKVKKNKKRTKVDKDFAK